MHADTKAAMIPSIRLRKDIQDDHIVTSGPKLSLMIDHFHSLNKT